MSRRLHVAFVHPDLGLGGAERLVVDAACELRNRGHTATIFTAHHDPMRCFAETRDGTLDVRAAPTRVPMTWRGRLRAPLAILRTAAAARAALALSPPADVFFCDLVPHVLPILKRAGKPIVFYCHFPDLLLAPRGGQLRRLYRIPIDELEAFGMGMADTVLVNSRFTAEMFRRTFPRLASPRILHPGVDVERLSAIPDWVDDGERALVFLSLNRFDASKNLRLAIDAFALALARAREPIVRPLKLVLAGGFDKRFGDTVAELERRIASHAIGGQVSIERNVTDARKDELLSASFCVLHTPVAEHFGYGPLEAMAAGRPVIVSDRGGPLETVEHAVSGMVSAPTPEAFAAAMESLIVDPNVARRLAQGGRERARVFSRDVFGRRLEEFLSELS